MAEAAAGPASVPVEQGSLSDTAPEQLPGQTAKAGSVPTRTGGSAYAAEVPGRVCTATMPLQNGGTLYATMERINYATRTELDNGVGKHLVLAENDLAKRKALIRNGNTTILDYNADLDIIVIREFGPTKDAKARPENLMCSKKLFPATYFDIK